MASLVADYSDSDGEIGTGRLGSEQTLGALFCDEETSDSYSEDSGDDSSEAASPEARNTIRDQLPHPNFGEIATDRMQFGRQESTSSIVSSVFANPFLAEEKAKTDALERHVKMTSNTKSQSRTINGRQVCWNYRKGRCRFGHKCKFAHDSDLSADSVGLATGTNTATDRIDSWAGHAEEEDDKDDDKVIESGVCGKRKKPGLSNTLVPPKKSMRAYKKQQLQEQPWLQS